MGIPPRLGGTLSVLFLLRHAGVVFLGGTQGRTHYVASLVAILVVLKRGRGGADLSWVFYDIILVELSSIVWCTLGVGSLTCDMALQTAVYLSGKKARHFESCGSIWCVESRGAG